MAQQGAALQNYNNELVKCLEDLCQRRQRLTKEIEQDTVLLKQVEQEVAKLTAKMNALQTSLNKKIETKAVFLTQRSPSPNPKAYIFEEKVLFKCKKRKK